MSISDKLTTAAENVPKVYEAGKQAEYDDFWDVYQENGAVKSYNCSFGGTGWDDVTFKPKYPILPSSAERMFQYSGITDITKVDIDFSNCESAIQCFNTSLVKYVGVMDCRKLIDFKYLFTQAQLLKSIEKLILSSEKTQLFDRTTFQNCAQLTTIAMEGTIKSDFDIHWSPLTKESITSIVNALSAAETGKTVSFSQAAKEAAFTEEEWAALIAAKSNWTISLV